MRKILALVMALCMLLGMTAAVAESELPYVELDWYVCESTQTANQQVWDALNTYFVEKINAKINFHFISPDEYNSKMTPILMSGQKADIINVNSNLNYVEWTKKGAFVAIDELLTTYAPETTALVGEDFFDAMKVDGKIYGIPSVKDSVQMYSAILNKTVWEDLGVEIPEEITDYRDLVPYLYTLYEARNEKYPELKEQGVPITRSYPEITKWVQFEQINSLIGTNVNGVPGMTGFAADGTEVFSIYQTEEYKEMCRTIGKMRTDGLFYNQGDVWYFDSDRVFSNTYPLRDIGSGWVECAQYAHDSTHTYESCMVPYKYNVATTNYLHAAANCISSTSENPERAMMALELINTDEYVATTLRFGTEGDFWTQNEDGTINTDGTLNNDKNANFYWYGAQFGAVVKAKVPASSGSAQFMEKMAAANAKGVPGNMGFIFDPTPVQNEIAACSAVIDEFDVNLRYGKIDESEVEGELQAFSDKLDASGIAKIVAEAQAQLDAYLGK